MSATRTRLILCVRRRTLRHCFRSSANLRSEIPDMPLRESTRVEAKKGGERGRRLVRRDGKSQRCFAHTA